jgi:hypothetical protein
MLRTSGIIVVVCGPKDVRSLDCGLLGCLGGNSFLWARTWRVWPDVDVLGCVDSVLFQRFLSVRFIGGGGRNFRPNTDREYPGTLYVSCQLLLKIDYLYPNPLQMYRNMHKDFIRNSSANFRNRVD